MLAKDKILAAAAHVTNKWRQPCPACGEHAWALHPEDLMVIHGLLNPDKSVTAFLVGCTSCGFLAFLYPPIADPEGWADAERAMRSRS